MDPKKPLEGLRIVEYCMWIAAPAGPMMLADLGAEVIKVEDLQTNGDPFRRIGLAQGAPIKGEDGKDMNPWFDACNYDKQYVCLNVKTEEGRKVFLDLLKTADAFVTSVRQDVLERRGLDYETLKKELPDLPYIHFLGYGEKGPLKDKPAFDVSTYFAAGGYLANSVPSYSEYLGNFPMAGADCWSAGYTAAAVLTGVLESKLHGTGDYITLSLYGEAYWSQRLSLLQVQFGIPYPQDQSKPVNPIIANYKTKDGVWLVMCISEYNRYFNDIMEAIGRDDMKDHPVFSDMPTMVASGRRDELVEVIREAFKQHTAEEMLAAFGSRDMPLERCATYYDLLESEQGWANQFMEHVEYPTGDKSIAISQPITSRNGGAHTFERGKPIGTDNDRYLAELGYTADQIADLRAKGAIK